MGISPSFFLASKWGTESADSVITWTELMMRIPLIKCILVDLEIGSSKLFRTRNQLKEGRRLNSTGVKWPGPASQYLLSSLVQVKKERESVLSALSLVSPALITSRVTETVTKDLLETWSTICYCSHVSNFEYLALSTPGVLSFSTCLCSVVTIIYGRRFFVVQITI